jgi:diguanylate cyclase (GGDEF)-like protein
MGQDGSLQVLLLTGSAELADRAASALREQLSASVELAGTLADLEGRTAGVALVVVDLRACEETAQRSLTSVRALAPGAAVLLLLPTGSATEPLPGADGSAELEHAMSSDQRLLADAARNALSHRVTRAEAEHYRGLTIGLLESIDAAACLVDELGRPVAGNQRWADTAAAGDEPTGSSEAAGGLRRVLAGELDRFEIDHLSGDAGAERWFRLQVRRLVGAAGALLTDVDLTATSGPSEPLPMRDALTGLANRHLLYDRLVEGLAWSGQAERQVAIALFDLDRFKRVNDRWGHVAGDEMLRQVAKRLEQLVAGTDTLSRFADNEFVAVRPGVGSAEEAQLWAAQLLTAFDEPFVLESQAATVDMTASVGVYVAEPLHSVGQILHGLDVAVREANNDGPGRTRLYTEDLGRRLASRLRTEHEIREGIAAGEFALYYQPVIDLRLRKVVGVEALLRWCHPDGTRMPDTFIPIAEESGLIVPLGGWVVEEACRQARSWSAAGLDLEMAVNLSGRQVSHPDTIATIADALTAAGLEPRRLLVEVTESAVVEDADAALQALTELSALGVRIAIDDFGTGYSSLLYLKRYPIQVLKVDRSFVSGMGVSDDDDAIVASVVSLAKAVGAVCIAEGVETEAQHGALLALGCRYAQGYLFGRPVAADRLPDLVADCDRRLQLPVALGSGSRKRRLRLKVNPEVVSRIEQLHGAGASLHTIAAALNKEHVPTDHGGRWVSATVARVIASGRATG